MNDYLASFEAAFREVKAMPPPVLLIVLHSQKELADLIRKMPIPKDQTIGGFGQFSPYSGPDVIVEPEIAREPGKCVTTTNREVAAGFRAYHARCQERRAKRIRDRFELMEFWGL